MTPKMPPRYEDMMDDEYLVDDEFDNMDSFDELGLDIPTKGYKDDPNA